MKYILSLLALSLPIVTFAAEEGILAALTTIGKIVNRLIPIGIGIALVVFIWGLLKYIIAADEEAQKAARNVMIYGVIVLFVIVSVWGLVELLGKTLDINSGDANINVPTIPGL